MPPIEPVAALTELTERLNHSGVRYMLVGGAAAYFYGYRRYTDDFDFVVDLSTAGVAAFVEAFTPGFYCDALQIADAIEHEFMFNVVSHTTGAKADCVILKSDAYQRSAMDRRRTVDWNGTPLWVMSGQDMVISKLLWSRAAGGSEKQRADVRMIMASGMVEEDEYFRHWIRHFGFEADLEACRQTRYDE